MPDTRSYLYRILFSLEHCFLFFFLLIIINKIIISLASDKLN